MEIRDNTFQRQFETQSEKGLVTVEYSFQERKIFLTRINTPEGFSDDEFLDRLIITILNNAIERKLKVVPVLPKIATFFRKNPSFRDLLPPGIRL
jgi:hypothetical protein